jgi:hypothetical protein
LTSEQIKFVPLGFALPHLPPEIDEFLGAQHLYEQMAILQELSYRTLLGGGMDTWITLLSEDVRYRRVLNLWHHYFPHAHALDNGRMRDTDIVSDIYRIFPVEFYAALDLALWVPFLPTGFSGVSGAVRWEDVQPGHRFLRAIQFLKDAGTQLTPITADHREARFSEVQNWVASELGWMPAEKLAFAWHEYLGDDRWWEDGLFVGERVNSAVTIARTMLSNRILTPFDSVCNNSKGMCCDELRFSHWITNEGPLGYQLHDLSDNAQNSSSRDAFFVFRGCDKLLFGECGYLDNLDAKWRQTAVEVLGREFAYEGWNQAYFQEMAWEAFS